MKNKYLDKLERLKRMPRQYLKRNSVRKSLNLNRMSFNKEIDNFQRKSFNLNMNDYY